MEKLINLPTIDAITEFVHGADESGDTVLVSKDGFRVQIDGSSLLGMMSVIGSDIRVKCLGTSERLRSIIDRYSIAR